MIKPFSIIFPDVITENTLLLIMKILLLILSIMTCAIYANRLKQTNVVTMEKGCFATFSQCDFKGDMNVLCGRDLKEEFSAISSIKLGPDTKIHIYQKPGFEGEDIILDKDSTCILTDENKDLRKYSGEIGSIKVIKN